MLQICVRVCLSALSPRDSLDLWSPRRIATKSREVVIKANLALKTTRIEASSFNPECSPTKVEKREPSRDLPRLTGRKQQPSTMQRITRKVSPKVNPSRPDFNRVIKVQGTDQRLTSAIAQGATGGTCGAGGTGLPCTARFLARAAPRRRSWRYPPLVHGVARVQGGRGLGLSMG